MVNYLFDLTQGLSLLSNLLHLSPPGRGPGRYARYTRVGGAVSWILRSEGLHLHWSDQIQALATRAHDLRHPILGGCFSRHLLVHKESDLDLGVLYAALLFGLKSVPANARTELAMRSHGDAGCESVIVTLNYYYLVLVF